MFGNNLKLPPIKGDGLTLEIQEIFSTFQGEGLYTGWPAIFIRLGGCNLACDFCDTEFEQYQSIPIVSLVEEVERLNGGRQPHTRLVVITGGEPFRQPIAPLCSALLGAGYRVQIETNGTLYRDIPEGVDIVCSPKNTGKGYQPLREDLLARITALKFIISAVDERYNHVAEIGQTAYNIPVYVQPMDVYNREQNRKNHQFTLELARKHGYRISLQTHKIWRID